MRLNWISLDLFYVAITEKVGGICLIGVLAVLDKFVGSNLRMVSSTSKKGLDNLLLDLEIISEPIKFVHNTSGTLIGMAHIMLPF